MGALNPNGSSVALFSNVGPWVSVYAPGASVLSTSPPFNGGVQAGSRNDRYRLRRETIDPDDYRGGYVLWSGTSFAAPLVAGRLARVVGKDMMDGSASDEVGDRSKALASAAQRMVEARNPARVR